MKGTYTSKFYLRIFSMAMVIGMMWCIKTTAFAESEWVREKYQTSENISTIVVEEMGMGVTVQMGQTDHIVVEYSTLSTEKLYTFSVSNNELTIKKMREVSISIDDPSNMPANYGALVITLPQKQYESIIVKNPSDGAATFENVNSKTIAAEVTRGAIHLTQTHSQNVFAETDSGVINLERTDATNYQCQVNNGQITGTIIGDKADYSIVANVKHGTNNLSNQIADGKSCSIKFEVEHGQINVRFINGR